MSADQATETDKPGTEAGYTPFRIDTSRPPVTADRMPLFYIDEREYTGPVKITGAQALRALDMTVRQGAAAGAWHCLVEAIGREAVDDLLSCEQVSYEEAQDMLSKISAMYYGQASGLLGK